MQDCTVCHFVVKHRIEWVAYKTALVQAPEAGTEAELFTAVQGIMEASAQSLRMTRLSGRRDMSTLLAQSAFSVSKPCKRQDRHHLDMSTLLCHDTQADGCRRGSHWVAKGGL